MTNDKKHLYNLDELSDYKVADGYSDVRNWDVKDRDNRVIGKVKNLLVSPEAERVVYLDVEVDKTIIDAKYDPYTNPANPEVREFINKDGENHVILPIGLVDLNTDQKYVLTKSIDHRTFAETKRYEAGTNIDREYEVAVLDSYNRNYTNENVNDDHIREIVKEEISSLHPVNVKETELRSESKIRQVVRDELDKLNKINNNGDKYVRDDSRPDSIHDPLAQDSDSLAEKRARLHRDDFERREEGMDFDHDNDGNPNITDPDYYEKKGRDIKNADYDHDNDGNPNITDPDYYEKKGRDIKNADYDHDNDGNPNISDPDYYRDKLGSKDKYYKRDGRHFYERREFDDKHLKK